MIMTSEDSLPIVLIPGFMLDESLWDEVVEGLPPDRKVHRANLRHGQTIDEITQSIVVGAPSRFILVGFSLGGYIARSLAHQFPNCVAGLILITTSLRPETPAQRLLKQAAVEAAAGGRISGSKFGLDCEVGAPPAGG